MGYLLRPNRERLRRIQGAIDRIVRLLPRTDVVLAILFGSAAKEDVGVSSDIDLLLVRPTEERFIDRGADLEDLFACPVGFDLVVYTPEEFARMKRENPFVRHAVETGKVIYVAGSGA